MYIYNFNNPHWISSKYTPFPLQIVPMFFKHSYCLFWECLYFLSIGLLWILGNWLWEGGGRLKTPLRQTQSFLYLSAQCPYWLHHGPWPLFLPSSWWSFEMQCSIQKNNFLYCRFCNCYKKKLQQLSHTVGRRIYSKAYQQSETHR